MGGVARFHLLIRGRIVELQFNIEMECDAERTGQQERNAPSPLNHVCFGDERFDQQGRRRSGEQAHGCRCGNKGTILAAMFRRGVFSQKDRCTRIFARSGKSLNASQCKQQNRRKQSDRLERRKAADQECRGRHQKNRRRKRPFAAFLIAHASPKRCTERTEYERKREYGERHQCGIDRRFRKEHDADRNGEIGVGGIVEPFEKIPKE